jgi:hypothetical protein
MMPHVVSLRVVNYGTFESEIGPEGHSVKVAEGGKAFLDLQTSDYSIIRAQVSSEDMEHILALMFPGEVAGS